ncbi:DUF4123 domain-containing protein [uncultured Litoreibacter sp.]|uniref:DUF4123 domain-containing protein n=1 Tax=uncultured Litoreibacter sp. TaxID=1392394 RepID=UPI00260FC115|nr:DUF4123 domain-containing protein [uncultured Litoreibacter sp.]
MPDIHGSSFKGYTVQGVSDEIWLLDGTNPRDNEPPISTSTVFEVHDDRATTDDWIPTALKTLLFPDGAEPIRTYLLVDSTLRTSIVGLFDLDVLDVPVACLFNGDAAGEQKEVAPYLVDLTLIGDVIPRFHREFFAKHWGQGTGILITSSVNLDQLKRHFRKFTRLKRERDERWFLFRFWDPAIASVYFRAIEHDPVRAAQWFGQGLVQTIVIEEELGKQASVFDGVAASRLDSNAHLPPVVLTEWELEPFKASALDRHIEEMAQTLKSDFAPELSAYRPEVIKRHVRPAISRFMRFGFKRREHLHVIAAWALFFGPEFDEKDPDGRLQSICASQEPEVSRFKALKLRMDELGTRKEQV